MKVLINTHHHDWDCETCGGSSSTTISFDNSELGYFEDGEPATCFTGKDGDLYTVLKELNSRLKERGISIDLKEFDDTLSEKYYEIMESLDWDFEAASTEQNEIISSYDKSYEEYILFYAEDSLIEHYSKHGIFLEFEETCDEIEYDDYDADEHDQYYSDLFDNGYTTDDSYTRDDE
ncbi:hypothetical protein GAP32_166 [Cronobacter phage vB_CsaM_GAP32]|uniref:Uncharacterized protein n=1 Tax=Cronobacter phage vB_CsaM_GAP32 TaxID=1141136 RepID=K4F5W4_9CAUD|nr:hypothetical protein GAP32_166 [Cronobacter phage vB_CsaM_GAP32]AFC21616.1 hypothetical protein GAP32_166 [Cronobacter phage vB_CsaM_GAP32]